MRLENAKKGQFVKMLDGPYIGGVFRVTGHISKINVILAKRFDKENGKVLEVGDYGLYGARKCKLLAPNMEMK